MPARDALVPPPLPRKHRCILHCRRLLLLGLIANLIFGFLPKPCSWDRENPCSRVRASLFTAASAGGGLRRAAELEGKSKPHKLRLSPVSLPQA